MMENADLIEKIKKCLALGGSCEPHEATQAIKKAQQLMTKHGITTDDVALSEVQEKFTHLNNTFKPPIFLRYLVAMIKSAFGCDAIYHSKSYFKSKKKVTVSFIGFDPNIQLATYAFEVLREQLLDGRKVYLQGLHNNCKKTTKTRRANLWAESWVQAANTKVSKLTLTQEQSQTMGKWIQKKYTTLTESKNKQTKIAGDKGDLDAVCQGLASGSKASLFHPVSGQQGPLGIGDQDLCKQIT